MDRRKFLKLMSGVASLPIIGSLGKGAQKAKKGIVAAGQASKMTPTQSILPDVIATVMKKGKEFDTGMPRKSHIGKEYKGVRVIESPDEIDVQFYTDNGNGAFANIKKADYVVDEAKGTTTYVPPQYEEGQQVYRAFSPDDYVKDVEFEILDSVSGLRKIAMEGKVTEKIKDVAGRIAKRQGKADGGRVGLQAGGPPIYQTTDPKEAAKEIIRRIPQLGGAGYSLPIYSNNGSDISAYIGTPGDQVPFGIGGNIEGVGNVGIAKLRGMDDYGNPRSEYNAHWSAGTGIPNLDFDLQYNTERGPRFDLRYEKRFANGGLTDTIPPEKGPMSQGIESLFQTR